ncbi:MAG: hypothetical protein WKG01_40700, partial [Kofleriaceae bacterium]
LATNKLATNKLATNKLATNRFVLNPQNADELLSTPDGREVLTYLVGCAVPADQVLVGTHDGTTYEFYGELGLAPGWLRHRLDRAGKGWVSACMFSRVNVNNVALPVSLRGPNRKLDTTPEERAGWTLEEGAFYGNLFTPGDQPINWIACRGEDQAAGESGGLVERDCAEPDPANPGKTLCGFKYAGDCGTFAEDEVCEGYSTQGTYYRRCHTEPFGRGHSDHDDDDDDDDDHDDDDCGGHGHGHGHHHSRAYREVITTFTVP